MSVMCSPKNKLNKVNYQKVKANIWNNLWKLFIMGDFVVIYKQRNLISIDIFLLCVVSVALILEDIYLVECSISSIMFGHEIIISTFIYLCCFYYGVFFQSVVITFSVPLLRCDYYLWHFPLILNISIYMNIYLNILSVIFRC